MTRPLTPVNHPIVVRMKDGTELTTSINPQTRMHEVQCDICLETIVLTVTGHPRRAQTHRGNKQCDGTRKKKGLPPRQYPSQAVIASAEAWPASEATANMEGSEPGELNPEGFPHWPDDMHPEVLAAIQAREQQPKQLCPGLTVPWMPGSIWTTYPYHQHAEGIPSWTPENVNDKANTVSLRSNSCSGFLPATDVPPCTSCLNIQYSAEFIEFLARALEAKEHTPWKYLNSDQTHGIMRKMAGQLQQLRSKIQSMGRSNKVYLKKVDDYQRIMMLIASNEIAGLRRLLKVSLHRGASPEAIVGLIHKSLKGLYSPRGGFSERELDIAFLVKAIGGPRLLYALQKSHGFASRTTLGRRQRIPRLLSSIGSIQSTEVDHNIGAFLDPDVKPPPEASPSGTIPGNILMFDDVALEGRCRYCPRRNHVIGLCREHGENVNTEVTSLESIENIRNALFDPTTEKKVCFGTNATVVALAPYARSDHYSPVPLVASPSDKSEKAEDLAAWIKIVLESYKTHKFGERINGNVWAIGSDGDATFRRAKHLVCMTTPLSPQSPLGEKLSKLRGLNLLTSPDFITGTCDPKHIFKRFATLLRNTLGVMIFGTNLRPHDIILYLSKLPDMSLDKARQLLDPSDKQNVPKAVSLIQHLSKALPESTRLTDSEEHRRETISFFAKMLGSFVEPFITIDMDLVAQLSSLATYAHLAAAIQIKHGSACLTGPLYADSQAVVKNIFFTVARLQVIDGDLHFYLLLEGTDRLEGLFSDCRTQDHARNFDIEQLCQKLGVATLVNAAFERNPDLDQGHRRLSLKNALGVDHVNPKSWVGKTSVGDINLQRAWLDGREKAEEILTKNFGAASIPDFESLFSKPGYDLLRPQGDYVGIKSTTDDNRSELEVIHDLRIMAPPRIHVDALTPGSPCECELCIPRQSNPGPGVVSTSESTAETISSNQDATAVSASLVNMLPDNTDDDEFEDVPLGMDVDDYFPEDATGTSTATMPAPISGSTPAADLPSPPKFPTTIIVNGKPVLKSSAVAILSSNRSKRVTMRTLRAAGAVLDDFQSSKFSNLFDASATDDIGAMRNGDLGSLLVRSNGKICLAIVEVTNFLVGKDKALRTAINISTLSDRAAHITVVGQILELTQSTPDAALWEWSKRYLQLHVDASSQLMTRNQFVIEVSDSTLFHPLAPSLIRQVTTSESNERMSWRISTEQIINSLNSLWAILAENSDELIGNVASLPEIVNPQAMPYRDSAGQEIFYVKDLPASLVPKPKPGSKDKLLCFICGDEKPLQKMRDHIGHHILRALRPSEKRLE